MSIKSKENQKVKFLKGKVLVEQNEVSILFNEKEQITITVLENGSPVSVRVSAKCVYDLLSARAAKQS